MRELRYRAWDRNFNRMLYTDWNSFRNWYTEEKGGKVVCPRGSSYEKDYLSPPMSQTGLQDKNKKDIYEGDIIRCADGKHYPVSFEAGTFMIDNEPLCFDLQAEEREPMRINTKDFATVIGNIYENPELITK